MRVVILTGVNLEVDGEVDVLDDLGGVALGVQLEALEVQQQHDGQLLKRQLLPGIGHAL